MSSNKVATTSTQNIVPVQAEFDVNGNCLGLVGPGGVFFNPPISTDTITNSTITGSTINSTSIGATTPSTGAFTTLTANTLNLTNALGVANGGTGLSTLTSGYIPYGNGTSAFGSSANLTFNGTLLSVTGNINSTNTCTLAQTDGQLLILGNQTAGGAKLDVQTASGTASTLRLYQQGVSNFTISVPASTDALTFSSYAGERMRIDSSGNLLVGTTSASINNSNSIVLGTPTAANLYVNHLNGVSSGYSYATFGYNGSQIGSISQSGTTAVNYNTSSDQRLKTNIVDAPDGNIDQIKIRSFDWKSDGTHNTYGVIAQELVEVAPYAVHQPTNPDEMMGVDYSKLVPMMIKEIQDLKAEVNQLKQKLGV